MTTSCRCLTRGYGSAKGRTFKNSATIVTNGNGRRRLSLIATVIFMTAVLPIPSALASNDSVPNRIAAHQKDAQANRLRQMNNSVLRLLEIMQQQSSNDGRAAVRAQAATLLKERRTAVASFIAQDAAQAGSFAFSPELLVALSESFPTSTALLESHVTLTGPIEYWVEDAADLKSGQTRARLKAAPNTTVDLYFAGGQPGNLKSGDVVQVTGVVAGYAMAVSSTVVAPSSTLVSATTSTTSSCNTTGVQNTAVLLVTFPGVALPSTVTSQSINDVFFGTSTGDSVDGFLRAASYGRASMSGNVFGPYTLTGTYASCSDVGGAVLNDAIAAAVAGGANLQNYNRVFLVFPDTFNCGWAGYANVGSCSLTSSSGTYNASTAYVVASYAASRAQGVAIAAHEIGHNLGLLHAGTVTPSTTTDVLGPLTAPGAETDMGDYWSVMGETVLGLYPAQQKAEVLGWMAPNTNYQVVQSSGTFMLQPLETIPAGLQALKVQRGTGNNEWLWIEYRQPVGSYDSTLPSQPFSGALIHYEDSNTQLGHTYLANFTPTVNWSPALASGQSWTDPYSNLSLSIGSATANGLTVTVNYGAIPCAHANPTVTVSPANPSTTPGSSVSYTVSVQNNDASGCSATTFSLSSSQALELAGSFSLPTLSIAPGQSASSTLNEAVAAGTSPGTYAVAATATSGSYVGSGNANCTVTTPPSLSAGLSVPASSYTRRSTVPLTVKVVSGSTPVSGAAVTFKLARPDGSTATQSSTTNSSGTASWSYKLSTKSPTGLYSASVQASVTSSGSASTQQATSNTVTFNVQ